MFVHACRDVVPGYAGRDFGYGQNCLGNRRRRANRELSKLTDETRFRTPDVGADLDIFRIIKSHVLVFRRLMRKAGSDLRFVYNALVYI